MAILFSNHIQHMNCPEKNFLTEFFAALERHDLTYAVMRNAKTLPYSLNGSDIDILLGQGLVAKVAYVAVETARNEGGVCVVDETASGMRQLMFLGRGTDGWWGACIDLFEGLYSKGVVRLDSDKLIGERVKDMNGIWVLPEDLGQYVGFAKELIINGRYSERYDMAARRCLARASGEQFVNARVARIVRKALDEGRDCGEFVRKVLFLSEIMQSPMRCVCDGLAYKFSKIRRYFRPSGKMIAVLGTDGSGKSTVLDMISPSLNLMAHKQLVVHHLKPDFIPPLGRLRGVKYEPGYVCTNPHGSKPSGFIGSLLRITYLLIDYVLGYWLKVRRHLAKIPVGFWIFDRYAYDMLFDQQRFRLHLPKVIVNVYVALMPRPDIIVCLGGDPEKIDRRKPEIGIDEVRRQVGALKEFCKHNDRAVWIDTTQALDETKNAVLETLLRRLDRGIKS